MAIVYRPKLCVTQVSNSGTSAQRNRLLSDGSHLLCITKPHGTARWNDKELIVTPDEEYYYQAATGCTSSYYGVKTPGGSFAEGNELAARLRSIRDAKTVESWHEGSKPLYYYCARSFPPCRMRYDTSMLPKSSLSNPVNIGTFCDSTTIEKIQKTLEIGASWKSSAFNLYAFPTGMCSSFKAYWRIWNPSTVHSETSSDGAVDDNGSYGYVKNDAGVIHYVFSEDLQPPNHCETNGFFTIPVDQIANEGNVGSCEAKIYDMYDTHNYSHENSNGSNTKSFHQIFVLMARLFSHTKIYYKSDGYHNVNDDEYYSDYEITGAALTALKNVLKKGKFYVHFGFNIQDMCSRSGESEGIVAYSTMMVYASRIELRIVASLSEFNSQMYQI